MSVIKLIHLNPYNDTCFAKAGILLHLVGEIQSYAQSFKPLVVQKPLIYASIRPNIVQYSFITAILIGDYESTPTGLYQSFTLQDQH